MSEFDFTMHGFRSAFRNIGTISGFQGVCNASMGHLQIQILHRVYGLFSNPGGLKPPGPPGFGAYIDDGIYSKYAQNMLRICSKYAHIMLKLCSYYAQTMLKQCSNYAQTMLKLCSNYAQIMLKICSNYAQIIMLKLCLKYNSFNITTGFDFIDL